jgi:uncharacterized protein (DUF1684 family)
MNKHLKYTLLAGIAVAIAFIIFYTFNNTSSNENYSRVIRKIREQKDKDFKYANSSPLTEEQKQKFQVLDYFMPDEKYKVQATLVLTQNDSVYKYLTTTNEIRRFYKYAYLDFSIDNNPQRLILLKSAEAGIAQYYFLAFKDLTSGTETYGGGRYLDIDKPKSNTVEIDFNKSYNPYCAYNDLFSCPMPPDENNLSIRILAGERVYGKLE